MLSCYGALNLKTESENTHTYHFCFCKKKHHLADIIFTIPDINTKFDVGMEFISSLRSSFIERFFAVLWKLEGFQDVLLRKN